VVEPLGNQHNRADFSCGSAGLDRYVKEQAGQDLRRGCAAPFVLVPERGGTSILGYYTLSSYGVDIGEFPANVGKKLPRYPLIPATLLGRLAVDRRYQGQGIGEFLLMDGLHRALMQSAEIAAAAVVVDAIDAGAVKFYQHFGFVAFPSIAGRLFLPMNAVAGLFR
jgi:GNAT superfamily N-acetyltransferase